MRIDIVACYYKQARFAPFFFWGLKENRESIGKVFIVNDEPWDDAELIEVMAHAGEAEIETHLFDHPHAGYGVAKSMNQGITQSSAEYVFLTSFDQILTPGTLLDISELAAPGRMVLGRVDSIGSSTKLEDLPDPKIIRPDMYDKEIPELRINPGQCRIGSWRNGHTLIHRTSHDKIGRFDERFIEWGYGLEDQDYCIRWLLSFGQNAIVWGDSSSWHFAGDAPSGADPKKYEWHPEAVKVVNDNLNRLYVRHKIKPLDQTYYQHTKGDTPC